jgi:hypothetical protein
MVNLMIQRRQGYSSGKLGQINVVCTVATILWFGLQEAPGGMIEGW